MTYRAIGNPTRWLIDTLQDRGFTAEQITDVLELVNVLDTLTLGGLARKRKRKRPSHA